MKVLKHWQHLKVYRISLEKYLSGRKIELLQWEIESSTGIQLKTLLRWLISKNCLIDQQKSENKRGSTIIITIKEKLEAKHSCASGLQFGEVVKVIEKY